MTATRMELVLASSSPRRHDLIRLMGMPFRVEPSRYEEPPPPDTTVSLPDLVSELAANKALEVALRLGVGWVLGADTLVSLDEHIGTPLGKPADSSDARRMLGLLSGRSHFVYSGIAVVPPWDASGEPRAFRSVTKTRVRFRRLSDDMISDYVVTGEPLDKAGAYGAQGYAAPFIEAFEGDFYNVVGLPLCDLGRLLERCGLDWRHLRSAGMSSPS